MVTSTLMTMPPYLHFFFSDATGYANPANATKKDVPPAPVEVEVPKSREVIGITEEGCIEEEGDEGLGVRLSNPCPFLIHTYPFAPRHSSSCDLHPPSLIIPCTSRSVSSHYNSPRDQITCSLSTPFRPPRARRLTISGFLAGPPPIDRTSRCILLVHLSPLSPPSCPPGPPPPHPVR
jgi:hypothetical protein